jgi:outer membrane protein assembly factor BamA
MPVCKPKVLATLIIASIWISPNALSGQCPVVAKLDSQTIETSKSPISPSIKIKKIVFEGQTGLSSIELADIAEKTKDKVGNYEPKWLEEFEGQLVVAWHMQGYFKAEVTAKARETSSTSTEKAFVVIAQVESGRRYYLGEISFLNGTQFSSTEMRSMFPLQTDELFNTHRIHDGLEALKAYGSRGFVDFTPVPKTAYDEVHGRISVEIDLNEGKQFRISETKALGIDPVSAKTLLQNSGLEPGNVLDSAAIERFQSAHAAKEILTCLNDAKASVTLYVDFREPHAEDQ